MYDERLLEASNLRGKLGEDAFDSIKDELYALIDNIRADEFAKGVETASYYYVPGEDEVSVTSRRDQIAEIMAELGPINLDGD